MYCVEFYSLSSLRDLLFNAQEHHNRLEGVEFVGFRLLDQLVQRYHENFADDPIQIKLAN